MANDTQVFLSGIVEYSGDSSDGVIAVYNPHKNTIDVKASYNLSYRTFALQSFVNRERVISTFGVFLNDTSSSRRLKSYFRKQGIDTIYKTYQCSGYNNYGGCQLTFRNALKTNENGYLFSSYAGARYEPNFRTGVIIKTDSLGNEKWRMSVGNDSTSCHNLLVAPLANGNYLAVWRDFYFKPNKSPDNSRYPTLNENLTIWCLEITARGEKVRKWNLKEELKYKHFTPSNGGGGNHLIVLKDSSIVITGNLPDLYYEGFLLKLDKYGNYKWYRKYHLNITKPNNLGEERLYLNGVTELKSGGFALAGEYRSDPSDSFPLGAQKGVVLFVDEHGCFKPNCHLTDNVEELKAKRSVFTVYPNPNNGEFSVSNEQGNKLNKVEVLDMNGRVVFMEHIEKHSGELKFKLPGLSPQIYFLKLFRDDGFFEVHKVVVW